MRYAKRRRSTREISGHIGDRLCARRLLFEVSEGLHVDITVNNYRWRISLADGESKYDGLENRLAELPVIGVPTITLEGDANGAPHPEPAAYAKKFSGKYEHRLISGGIGHNLPQEAPQAFAQAVVDVDRL